MSVTPATDASKQPDEGNRGRRAISIDPQALMKIKSLEYRAKAVVEGFQAGLHRSPYHGFSVEFTDYRPYTVGDDLRYLDWKLLARSDRRYIKRFEDETNLRCYLAFDNSQSMEYSENGRTKAEFAKTLAASVAYFLTTQRDAVGLITFDETIREVIQPRYRNGQLRQLFGALDRLPAGRGTALNRPLELIAQTFHKRGLVVLISDFLAPLDGLKRELTCLKSLRHELVLIRVLHPSEVNFDFDNATLFVDQESGREIYVDPQTIKSSYLKKFREHQLQLEQCCNAIGARLIQYQTNNPLDEVLLKWVSGNQNRFEGRVARQSQETFA